MIKMKIVVTVNSLTKGSGLSKYVYNLCSMLSYVDDEIHIITTHAEQPDFEVVAFKKFSNIKVHQLHNHSKCGKYLYLALLLRKLNVDLVIINYHAPTHFVLPLCKKHSKVVHIIHGDIPDFYRIAAINASYIDGWVTPTPGVKDKFNHYTQNRYQERVTSIPHGVESPEKYNVISNRANNLELIFVGVIDEHKGVFTLPAVLETLHKRGFDFHLTMIGKKVKEDKVNRAFQSAVDCGLVSFTGVISPNEVYQCMANAHIFLYPTQIDSFGLVIAEAMMNGAVPVASHLKGITDALVDEGVNGYLIEDPKDADAFATRIEELAKDRALLARMSVEAKKKAESAFSLQSFHDNYELYFKIIMSK